MSIRIIKFPVVIGLPEGCENTDQLTSPDMFPIFFKATLMLREQVEQVLEESRPDCLVADMFFPWATESAAKFDSFYELEPDYVDHYRNVLNMKAWHVGPVSLCNRGVENKAKRGKKPAIDGFECLKWLDLKNPHSVIYVCFGSVCNFPSSQLYELAMGLEASGQQFIWVVRKGENEDEKEKWMPERFEERIEGKGLIIREQRATGSSNEPVNFIDCKTTRSFLASFYDFSCSASSTSGRSIRFLIF